MKIRFDFVTNSSSSSFVCIQFKSKKLKELLTKYEVQCWESSTTWDVYYKEDACDAGFSSIGSIEELLDWFVEDFMSLFVSSSELTEEYADNKELYYDDVREANYVVNTTYYGEFGDDEKDYSFEYKKPKKKTKKIEEKTASIVPENLRETIIDNLMLAGKNHSNIEEAFPNYKEIFIEGKTPKDVDFKGGWLLYNATVLSGSDGNFYYKLKETDYSNYQEEMDAFLRTPLDELDLQNISLTNMKLYLAREHIKKLKEGDVVRFYRQPDNPYDSYAVFVSSLDGDFLGFIDGNKAAYIYPFLEAKNLCWRGTFVGEVMTYYGRPSPGVTMELMPEGTADLEKGIFPVEVGTPGLSDEEVHELQSKIESVVTELKERYRSKKIPKDTYRLKTNNRDLPIDELRQWVEALNVGSFEQFIKENIASKK